MEPTDKVRPAAASVIPEGMTDNNPKTMYGAAKPPLHLIPAVALVHEAMAYGHGNEKYRIPMNWREYPVSASTYVGALLRHLHAWQDGEEYDPESGVHHLGSVRSNAGILLDAQAQGTLIDDRPKKGAAGDLIRALTKPIPAQSTPETPDEGMHDGP